MKSENNNKADSPFRSVLQAMPADFWRLWFVGMIASTVRWLETVVVGVVVYQQTGSAFVVAMMTMLRLLPMGLFGAFLGAFVERFDRRLDARRRARRDGHDLGGAGHHRLERLAPGLAPRGRQLRQRLRLDAPTIRCAA